MTFLKLPHPFMQQLYLAGPFETQAQRDFNQRIYDLLQEYNFPAFFPQQEWETCGRNPEQFQKACLDALKNSKLMLAIYYDDDNLDPVTAFEIGFAKGRQHEVIGLRNRLLAGPDWVPPADTRTHVIKNIFTRVVEAVEKDEDLVHPLVSVLNRFF